MLDNVDLPKQDTFQSNNSSTETLTVDSVEKNNEESSSSSPLEAISKLEKHVGLPVKYDDVDSFPDGGWEAWSCLFGLWFMVFFTNGSVNSYGIYAQYYAKNLLVDKSVSQIAWIGAMQLFFIFSLGVVAGRIFDMGYLRPVLATSTVMLVLCQLLTSLCTTYWQLFLAQGVGLGIAMGFVFQLCLSVPSQWFKKRRATAMGILASAAAVGSTVQPIFIKKVIPIVGFAWTMRIIALASAVILSGCFFLIKTRIPPRKVKAPRFWIDLDAFKMKSYTLFVIGATAIMMGIYTPMVLINTFTAEHHIPGDGYWLSVLNASSILGRLLPGLLADRYGPMTVLIPHAFIAAVLVFLFPLFDNLSITAFAILFGYTSGAWINLNPISVISLGPLHSVGSRMGGLFTLMSIAGLLGTPIAGLILGNEPNYRWWPMVGFAGSCISIGLVFCLFARHFAARELSMRP